MFDPDPVGRKANGDTRYRVYRDVEDPSYVMYGLEFDRAEEATAFRGLPALREAWERYEAENPQARVLEEIEAVEL